MSSKKAKTSIDGDSSAAVMVVVQDEESWDKVVSYIQKCPHVSPNHPALQAAIKGVEQERKRRERDAKLQQRFAAEAASAIPSPTRNETPVSISQSEILRTSSSNNNNNKNHDIKMEEDDDGDEDWHDVNAVGSASGSNNNGANGTTTNGAAAEQVNNSSSNTSFLGERLATDSVRLLAQHSVQTKSPVAAMASIVHAALNCLDFTCTGIPDSGPSGGGFAAPVRAITTFLPSQWDAKANNNNKTGIVLLRYRQEGLGSVVLKVESVVVTEGSSSPKVRITWTPGATTATSTEPSSTLDFALETHLNLESWNRASHNGTMPVAPSLHFKALAALLTQLTQTLDLGEHGALQKPPIYGEASMPPILAAAPNGTNGTTTTTASFQPPQPVLPQQQHHPLGPDPSIGGGYGYEVPTTVHGAFPGLQVPRNGGGQFSGDLHPFMGGIGSGGGGGMSGNLMGPNHPSFGGSGSGMMPGDNGYLRPRIDPYGPPPTHFEQQPQHPSLRRPPAPGTPNHDHLRPPNNLNNNMFM